MKTTYIHIYMLNNQRILMAKKKSTTVNSKCVTCNKPLANITLDKWTRHSMTQTHLRQIYRHKSIRREQCDRIAIIDEWSKTHLSNKINVITNSEKYQRHLIERECINEYPPLFLKTLIDDECLHRYEIIRLCDYLYEWIIQRYIDEYNIFK